MDIWIKILAGAVPSLLILTAIFIVVRCCRGRKQKQQVQFISNSQFPDHRQKPSEDRFQSAIARLHLSHHKSSSSSSSKTSLRFHHLHHHHPNQGAQGQAPPPFSWDSHPRLISDAVENGWSRFVFAHHHRAPVPRTSPLRGLCAICDGGMPIEEGEIGWEVPAGSSEYMQTIRINPSTTKSPLRVADDSGSSCCCIRMSFPLPGPPLMGTSFPQEAYFEITILYLQPINRAAHSGKRAKDGSVANGEDDRVKLIEDNSVSGDEKKITSPFQEANSVPGEGKHKDFLVSLGLTGESSPLTKWMPGTYPGSIAFYSNGSVYLDGMKLVAESEKTGWAAVNRVIGCGFNPSKKRVFLTVDSELVHAIRCNSDAYRSPLYPILSSNLDVMVLVNLGQAQFKYAPANAHRTTNPCFIRSSPSHNAGSVTGYEDSRELFSIGRIDSESWLDNEKKNKSAANTNSKSSCRSSRKSSGDWEDASVAVDVDGESDLFEISLQN